MTRRAPALSKRDGRKLLGIADLLELAVPEIRQIGRAQIQKPDVRKPKKPKRNHDQIE